MFLSSPSCVFHRSKKSFLEKISFEKIVDKTSFISSWFLLHLYFEQKLFSIFSCPFIFCVCRVISFFFFFWSFFTGVCFSTQKKGVKKSFEKHIVFFPTFSFELFLEEGTYLDPKCVEKLTFVFSSKKKSPLKNNSRFTRVEDCVREWRPSWPLLRVVTLLRESSLCAFSCHSSRPRDIRHIKPSLSFFSASLFVFCFFFRKPLCKKCSVNVFLYPFCSFSNFSNTFLTSLVRFSPKSKFSWQKIHFSSSFSCFYSHVSFPFCLSLCFCQGDLIAEDKTRHQEKWVEGSGGNGHQCLKRRSLVGVFLSMTEGLSWWTWINQGECLGWWFLARFGSNSVFLVIEWVVCDTDSPRDTRKWMLIIISLCPLSLSTFTLFMFTLLPQHLAKSYWKDWAIWGGEAEPGR